MERRGGQLVEEITSFGPLIFEMGFAHHEGWNFQGCDTKVGQAPSCKELMAQI